MRIKQHLLDVPPGCDVVTFFEHGGKPPAEPTQAEGLTTSGNLASAVRELRIT
jgi:hypothetical protein